MMNDLQLSLQFISDHPEDAARVIENLPYVKTIEILSHISDDDVWKIFPYLTKEYAASCLVNIPLNQRIHIITRLPTQLCTAILQYFPGNEQKLLLSRLPPSVRLAFYIQNKYAEDRVGAWMNTRILTITTEKTVAEVQEIIAKSINLFDDYVFGVDSSKHLLGIVRTSSLLKAIPTTPFLKMLQTTDYSIQVRATLESAINNPGWKQFNALPVIDQEGVIVGVLSYTDLYQSLEQFRTDISAGMSSIFSEVIGSYSMFMLNSIQILVAFIIGIQNLFHKDSGND